MENDVSIKALIYFMIAGAVGLYLLMPRRQGAGLAKVGALVAGVALVGILLNLLGWTGGSLEGRFFGLFSAVAVVSAVMMITQRKALYSALFFVLTVLAVAALILLQQAEFLAVALVLIYAGAILVTYVFALTLSRQEDLQEYDTEAQAPMAAIFIGAVLMMGLLSMLQTFGADSGSGFVAANNEASMLVGTGSVRAVGVELFENHILALQIAGVLLLVAAVGGIAIVRHVKIKF